jgi:glycopeptide antibiotics resistance protein
MRTGAGGQLKEREETEMKLRTIMNGAVLPVLFAVYMYALFKVILFKFRPIDIVFLWNQLLRNLGKPAYIRERLLLANFSPFESISSSLNSLSGHDLLNLYGNIAIFIPFGVFLVLLAGSAGMTFRGVFLRSLGLSLILECLQVLLAIGSFDVDDLILNVLGGVLGFAGCKLFVSLGVRRKRAAKNGRAEG